MTQRDSTPHHVFMLGVSHHRAPIEIREKLALTADKRTCWIDSLRTLPGLVEFAVLNTCNRIEIIGVGSHPGTAEAAIETFCRMQNLPPENITPLLHSHRDINAILHLLEIAVGLDSQMVGEAEILGQVKDAYAAAQNEATVGSILNRVFQKCFQAAKHVRTHTAIGEGQVSIAGVSVDLALKIFGELNSTSILMLGAGDIGEKTARAFKSRNAGALTVVSRRTEKAESLAAEFSAKSLSFSDFPSALHTFDVVVCSTSAPDAVLNRPMLAAAMHKRPTRPLFLIDLAMPRDVDPAVAKVPNVFLYNLDDIAKIADENKALRMGEITKAREILLSKSTGLWGQIEPRLLGTSPGNSDTMETTRGGVTEEQ